MESVIGIKYKMGKHFSINNKNSQFQHLICCLWTTDQCIKAALTIKPKILYPYHYHETNVSEIVEGLKNSGIDVRIRDMG